MSPNPTVLDACTPGTPSARDRIWAAMTEWARSPSNTRAERILLIVDRPQGVRFEGLAFLLAPSLVIADMLDFIEREQTPSAGVRSESCEAGIFFQPTLQGRDGDAQRLRHLTCGVIGLMIGTVQAVHLNLLLWGRN